MGLTFLDGPVHPLDLTVRPRVVRLGKSVLDPVGLADHVEAHGSGIDRVSVSRLLGELDTVVHCLAGYHVVMSREGVRIVCQRRSKNRPRGGAKPG